MLKALRGTAGMTMLGGEQTLLSRTAVTVVLVHTCHPQRSITKKSIFHRNDLFGQRQIVES